MSIDMLEIEMTHITRQLIKWKITAQSIGLSILTRMTKLRWTQNSACKYYMYIIITSSIATVNALSNF
jgi:hypothetical protein